MLEDKKKIRAGRKSTHTVRKTSLKIMWVLQQGWLETFDFIPNLSMIFCVCIIMSFIKK